MQVDYYYGTELEQSSFYKLPKFLMKEECLKGLSNDAKVLYALMLDRMSLSKKNEWLDEENRVYIIYKLEHIIDDLNCSRDKAMKVVAELEKNVGLIERKKRGQGKPTLIYMKKFMECDVAEDVMMKEVEQPIAKESEIIQVESMLCSEVEKNNLQKYEIPTSRSRENRPQEVAENDLYINKTNINKNNMNHTNLIYPIHHTKQEDVIDTMDKTVEYIELIKGNIEYDWYMKYEDSYGQGYSKLYDELFQVICDVVCVQRYSLKIGGQVYPYELVKSRFLKLKPSHLDYVIECMQKTTTRIGNIKAYMITALYNAPNTMHHYYQQEVQWDRYTCR